jgi:hypothetical protein
MEPFFPDIAHYIVTDWTSGHYLLSMGSCPLPHRNKFGNVVNLVSYSDIDQTDLRHKIRKMADRSEKMSR